MAPPSSSAASSSARHHVIESLTIDGGTHFPAAHLPFVEGLNCLIGPGGSGKTTILHIDQPEDQLDNAFVYDALVPTLRVAKTSRQILSIPAA